MSYTQAERLALIRKNAEEGAKLRRALVDLHAERISDVAARMAAAIGGGHKILICGNGGSAADSSHLATELVVRLTAQRNRPALPAISLAADASAITAAGNDFGFESIFARQVEALGQKGDLLLALSTSGNSRNLLRAVEVARHKGMGVIALLGGAGGELADKVDHAVIVPSDSTARIQEEHHFILHTLVELVELDLFA